MTTFLSEIQRLSSCYIPIITKVPLLYILYKYVTLHMQIYLDTFVLVVHRFTQLYNTCQPFFYVFFYYSALGHLYHIVGNYYISGNIESNFGLMRSAEQ